MNEVSSFKVISLLAKSASNSIFAVCVKAVYHRMGIALQISKSDKHPSYIAYGEPTIRTSTPYCDRCYLCPSLTECAVYNGTGSTGSATLLEWRSPSLRVSEEPAVTFVDSIIFP